MKQVDARNSLLDKQYETIAKQAKMFKLQQFITPFRHPIKLVIPL